MAKAKARPTAQETPSDAVKSDAPKDHRSSLDRMRDLTRRVIAVPRGEVAPQQRKPKRNTV